MKFRKIWLFIVVLGFISFSCNDDDPVVVNEAEVLVEYLESANSPLMKDYVNSDMPSIMLASEVRTLNATGQVYIIDIRSAGDFASGHIENAVNVEFGDILTHVEGVDISGYTKVAVVCYTGQTAGYATTLLRIMGYDNVYSMKWGMCSWHEDFASKWTNTIANGNTYATQFTSDATEKGTAGDLPTISTGLTEGQGILESRVDAVIAAGFGPAKVTSAEVFGNLDNYYIVNYWSESHYTNPGHIPGAMQYTPKASIKLSADLTTLPTDKTIVVYCYTGQTSAFLSAYLRVLGYDAKSLLFGANGMIYDLLGTSGAGHQFNDGAIMGYDYVQ